MKFTNKQLNLFIAIQLAIDFISTIIIVLHSYYEQPQNIIFIILHVASAFSQVVGCSIVQYRGYKDFKKEIDGRIKPKPSENGFDEIASKIYFQYYENLNPNE